MDIDKPFTDPVVHIGSEAVKTLFSCGQAPRVVTRLNCPTTSHTTRGAVGIARFPNFRGVFTSANLLRQKCCRHHCREYSRKHMDDAAALPTVRHTSLFQPTTQKT